MGMFLGDHNISSFFCLFFCLFFCFFWGGMPDIPIFRVGGKQWMHEEKLRVAPINDTFSVLSF